MANKDSDRQQMMFTVQKYNFAAYDLLLYLDTHPDDKKAFGMFRELVSKTRKAKQDFEEKYGPLEAYNAAYEDKFNWLEKPWPWEREAN